MKVLLLSILLLAAPAAANDHHREIEFHQASELLPWCETEARAHFAGRGVDTYQWTGRYHDRGNTLFVEGRIRAGGKDVPVACRVARGARERYAVIEIGN